MSSIYALRLTESTSMNEGEGRSLMEDDQVMLRQNVAGDHDDMVAWTHERGVASTNHDHFIPKRLLLFNPLPLSHYSSPTLLSQHEVQDQVAGHLPRGQNDGKFYDRGVLITDDTYPSKQRVTNCHDQCRDHGHTRDVHDPHPHHYGRHRHAHRDQQRFSRDGSNSGYNQVRTCVDCNTTRTPLWRSGPLGPKSLCNACGIRHHKARRARAAAAAAQAGENFCLSHTKSKNKRGRSDSKPNGHYKTKNKFFSPRGRKSICLDLNLNCEVGDDDDDDDALEYVAETTEPKLDLSVQLKESKPFTRVFPKDEEQAAILLMALSCGLVNAWPDLQ